MNARNLYIIFAVLLFAVASCELPDNIDPKNPTEVPAGTIFSNAEVDFANQVDELNVNWNISRLLVQYVSEVTYTLESRYNFQDRGIPDNYWINFYRDVLMDLVEVRKLLEAQELAGDYVNIRANQIAITEIISVYCYQALVDGFGNVPYSQALKGGENTLPAYDDAVTIYTYLFARLNAASNTLDNNFDSWGSDDLIYGGDVDAWKTFGASLALRMALRIADVNPTNARAIAEAAINTGVISSQAESGLLEYVGTAPHINAIYNHFNIVGRKDYCPTNTVVDMMNNLNDPRRQYLFTQIDTSTETGVEKLAYVGLPYGKKGSSNYAAFSHFSSQVMMDPTLPAVLIDYAEVEFLLAEAVERGYTVTGTAEEHYNNGIRASILYWGGTDAEADAYLAQPEVAYATAAGNWKQKIGTQKWLALYNRGVEAWAEWRRLDYPILNIPEDMTYADIPVRMPYPFDEGELNPTNYEAAVSAMGGDTPNIKLFWDIY